MADPISHTMHDNAPLSSANPNVANLPIEHLNGEQGDAIVGRTGSINRLKPQGVTKH